jgi:hypothetical protein
MGQPGQQGQPFAAADWPRPVTVTTAANGTFSVNVDPCNFAPLCSYDVTVRPVDGTGLPWIVFPDIQVSTTTPAPCLELSVPAPARLALTIHDPRNIPIADAVIRAYAFTACTPPSGQTTCAPPDLGPAIQIGEALTDGTGAFEMYLTPVPFQAGPPCGDGGTKGGTDAGNLGRDASH